MEELNYFMPLFVSIISFCVFFTFLALIVNYIVKPVKDNQKEFGKRLQEIEKSIKQLSKALTVVEHRSRK